MAAQRLVGAGDVFTLLHSVGWLGRVGQFRQTGIRSGRRRSGWFGSHSGLAARRSVGSRNCITREPAPLPQHPHQALGVVGKLAHQPLGLFELVEHPVHVRRIGAAAQGDATAPAGLDYLRVFPLL